jgi:ribosomal-protein-alanine N-acetyltransferase
VGERVDALAGRAVFIETPRLVLRTVTQADIAAVAATWKLDEGPISREEAQVAITRMLGRHAQNAPGRLVHLCLALIDKSSQEWIGWCGLDNLKPARPNPVIFYLLKARWWGQGLASEAARALLAYAFRELRLAKIDGGCAFENLASKRVMEKIGMRYLGLDEEGGHSFTITREDFFQAGG